MVVGAIIKGAARASWTGIRSGFEGYQWIRNYALLNAGLANVLAMQTLRHGTCFENWIRIQLQGADPNKGAVAPGETRWQERNGGRGTYRKDCENHFFVSKDGHDHSRQFSCQSASASWLSPGANDLSWSRELAACIDGLFTPTIRIHLEQQTVDDLFTEDPSMRGTAMRTPYRISPFNFGIAGSLKNGLNHRVFQRICHRPGHFALGVGQLTAFVLVATRKLGIRLEFLPFRHSNAFIRWPSIIARFGIYEAWYLSAW